MLRKLNLRERLVVVVAIALVPLVAVAVWDVVRDANAAADQAQAQLRSSASLLAANQDRAAEASAQLLGAIASVPGLRDMDPARCHGFLERLRERNPAYSNIALFGTGGEPLCHAFGEKGAPVRDRDYFRAALAQRGLVMGAPIIGRVSGRRALPFAMAVSENNAVVAVAVAALDLDKASHSLENVTLPRGAQVRVTDRHGHPLMESPEGTPGSGAGAIHAEAASRPIGDEGFIVHVNLPRDVLTRDAWARGREALAALVAVIALAAVAVWGIGGRMIVKPAKQILGAVRRIEQGRLDARVPVHTTGLRGEFGRIGAAFNLMGDSLQLRQADLEAELKRSRAAYAALDEVLNSMQEGLIAVTSDGHFLLHNRAAAQLFPLADAPVLPELWPAHFGIHHADGQTLYRADDLPLVRAALGASEGQAIVFVRNALVPEGRLLQCTWHRMDGEPAQGGIVMFTDVTELQRLQASQAAHYAQLQEAQRKLIESQRIGRIGNWEVDLHTGRLWWSDEVFKLFGVTRERFSGDLHAFESLVHPDDRPKLKLARDRALTGGELMEVECRIVRPDGSLAWIHAVGDTRRSAAGEPVWYGGMVQDVTQRKLAELDNARLLGELQELNASLESRIAERTAQLRTSNGELEAFAYSVSHDLRAPLAAISGFSSALQDKVAASADERVAHYAERIRAGVRKMEELIEALLELSRVVRAPLEAADVDLSLLARETLEALQSAEPRRQVTTRVDGGLTARGDPRLLRAVLENLVGNAWKFTSNRDAATIEVGRVDDHTFYVRDNGVGFDMAYSAKLFTAFQRLHTEREFPGTGIGLATVRRIVSRHQGRVWAESQPGRGTTFYFSLGAS